MSERYRQQNEESFETENGLRKKHGGHKSHLKEPRFMPALSQLKVKQTMAAMPKEPFVGDDNKLRSISPQEEFFTQSPRAYERSMG